MGRVGSPCALQGRATREAARWAPTSKKSVIALSVYCAGLLMPSHILLRSSCGQRAEGERHGTDALMAARHAAASALRCLLHDMKPLRHTPPAARLLSRLGPAAHECAAQQAQLPACSLLGGGAPSGFR